VATLRELGELTESFGIDARPIPYPDILESKRLYNAYRLSSQNTEIMIVNTEEFLEVLATDQTCDRCNC
jgi:hypothetical protein